MLEKMLILLIMYTLMLATDVRNLRNSPFRARLVYFGIVAVTVYLGADYLLMTELPNLHTIVDFSLTEPARMIVRFLKVTPA